MPNTPPDRERRAHLMKAERDKRQVDRGQQDRERRARDARDSSIETPVTPPSMKPLESRKPLMPIAADRIAARMSAAFMSSRRKWDLNAGSACGR